MQKFFKKDKEAFAVWNKLDEEYQEKRDKRLKQEKQDKIEKLRSKNTDEAKARVFIYDNEGLEWLDFPKWLQDWMFNIASKAEKRQVNFCIRLFFTWI